ncbi:unnamed protein product [Lymnaea stagnalis]|uniref:Uncharacterized protein n=1 Tax=Lymnaea stagnalis TaxID=6523 RepID=A0AAV2IAI8_LYMST
MPVLSFTNAPNPPTVTPPSSENATTTYLDCVENDSNIAVRLYDNVKRAVNCIMLEPYVPDLSFITTFHPTTDRIVGMTLHCFILSSIVLTMALIRLAMFSLKFACFITLNLAVFRGDIKDPITQEQLREATIFDTSGLKIIIVQYRTRNAPSPRLSLSPQRPRDSGSDSSQDIFSISSL